MIAKGLDPLEERHKKKSAPTFRTFVEESYMKWSKAHKKSWRDDDRMLKHDWLPEFGNVQLSAISRRAIQEKIMKIQDRSSGATSNRHISLISKIFSLAIELEVYEGENPCKRIKKFHESTGRERFLSKEEIKPHEGPGGPFFNGRKQNRHQHPPPGIKSSTKQKSQTPYRYLAFCYI